MSATTAPAGTVELSAEFAELIGEAQFFIKGLLDELLERLPAFMTAPAARASHGMAIRVRQMNGIVATVLGSDLGADLADMKRDVYDH